MRLACCCSTSEDGRKEHGIRVLFARVSTGKANSAPSCWMQVDRNHHFQSSISSQHSGLVQKQVGIILVG